MATRNVINAVLQEIVEHSLRRGCDIGTMKTRYPESTVEAINNKRTELMALVDELIEESAELRQEKADLEEKLWELEDE